LSRSFYLLLTLVRSLDAISFVLLSFLCIRDYRVRRTRWGGWRPPTYLLRRDQLSPRASDSPAGQTDLP